MNVQYACQFTCEDETFYWGPFPSLKEAKDYLLDAQEQCLEYYGKDIALRQVIEIHQPKE